MFHSAKLKPNGYASLEHPEFFSGVNPTPLQNARLAHLNLSLAQALGFSKEDFSQSRFADHLAGHAPLPNTLRPIATAYSGHQFGVFNPGLGDGRALLLAECQDGDGNHWELQLKGSGPTPYSRGFDGRAVLRSVIREYLASEALWALDIPTTRALCVIDSDTPVHRESVETGAMMIRAAPSHLRFGSFELFYSQGRHDLLKILTDYCIERYFPDLQSAADRYGRWFDQVVTRTARMVALWQATGFCHGVMNTDNFSILGLTFDYGPYGFLEHYDPAHICNHSDHEGRYAYDHQPRMALWNCLCLAQALTPLIERERLEQGLEQFEPVLQQEYLKRMRAKLGLAQEESHDSTLIAELLELLQAQQLDYTRFFRGLSHQGTDIQPDNDWITQKGDPDSIQRWLKRYQTRLQTETRPEPERRQAMLNSNPKYILRNYLAQQAIELAQQGDFSEVDRLLQLLQHPYDEHPQWEAYATPASNWASHLSVSCSS